jgi:F0F1-type ATP synthase membrane subunit c/vacuolar-type H+-ATPase subunit K
MTQATPPTQPQYAMITPEQQRAKDAQHLNLLSTFHYVYGGLQALFGCFPSIHLSIGIMMVNGVGEFGRDPSFPQEFGWFFIIMASTVMLFMWTVAVLAIMAGNRLRQRRSHKFCFVVACIECIFVPLGTVLGVFSLVVLMRDSVKQVFAERSPAQHAASRDSY